MAARSRSWRWTCRARPRYAPLSTPSANGGFPRSPASFATPAGRTSARPRGPWKAMNSTFGVNHLGHYLLARLLLPAMATGARILFVSSGTHDPMQKSGLPDPRYESAYAVAHDFEPGADAGRRRYATSKLCNVFCTYELARRLAGASDPRLQSIRVNAFDPGLMPGTGLARTYPAALRFGWNYVLACDGARSAERPSAGDVGAAAGAPRNRSRRRGHRKVLFRRPRDPILGPFLRPGKGARSLERQRRNDRTSAGPLVRVRGHGAVVPRKDLTSARRRRLQTKVSLQLIRDKSGQHWALGANCLAISQSLASPARVSGPRSN